MKMLSFFIQDGHLKQNISRLFSIIGVAAALSTLFFLDDLSDWRLWSLAIIGILFGYGSAWARLAKHWGYAPFTRDPLGWRQAKKTYDEDDDSR